MSKQHQWVYRPTMKEHEALLQAMGDNPEFTSVAQVVREAVLRFILQDDRTKLFTEVSELIDELHSSKEKFLTLVLKHSD